MRALIARIAEDDAKVCSGMNSAAELDSVEDGMALLGAPEHILQRRGFASKRQLRIAIDAKMAAKDAPAYLKFANDRLVARSKSEGASTGAPTANIVVVPIVQGQPSQPPRVIDVEET